MVKTKNKQRAESVAAKQKKSISWHFSLFISLLMLAFAWAVYAVGTSLDGATDLATNVLQQKRVKRRIPTQSLRKLRTMLAQTPIPPEIIHPTFLCYAPEEEKPIYQGKFVEQEITVETKKNEEFTVILYVENTGNVPWFSDRSGCSGFQPFTRLGTARDRDRASSFAYFDDVRDTGWIQSNRIQMVEDRVESGEIATFQFISKAPPKTDTYREYFQLVTEGVAWMERKEETVQVDIAVGRVSSLDAERLKFINKSLSASVIEDPTAPKKIEIDISDQKMKVFVGDIVARDYTVSTGTFKTPTPLGSFKILNKDDLRIGARSPHYRMPQWQGFTQWGHGLHALPYLANDNGVFWNEALNHIGRRVSHGCVRLLPEDAEDLYSLTAVGDSIVIQN